MRGGFDFFTAVHEAISWLDILIIGLGVMIALMHLRLSSWMLLVAGAMGGMVFGSVLSRAAMFMIRGQAMDGQAIQGIFLLANIIHLFGWIALVGGLLAVFRDVSRRITFLEAMTESVREPK